MFRLRSLEANWLRDRLIINVDYLIDDHTSEMACGSEGLLVFTCYNLYCVNIWLALGRGGGMDRLSGIEVHWLTRKIAFL